VHLSPWRKGRSGRGSLARRQGGVDAAEVRSSEGNDDPREDQNGCKSREQSQDGSLETRCRRGGLSVMGDRREGLPPAPLEDGESLVFLDRYMLIQQEPCSWAF
jgi:hypothetical protein